MTSQCSLCRRAAPDGTRTLAAPADLRTLAFLGGEAGGGGGAAACCPGCAEKVRVVAEIQQGSRRDQQAVEGGDSGERRSDDDVAADDDVDDPEYDPVGTSKRARDRPREVPALQRPPRAGGQSAAEALLRQARLRSLLL